MRAPVAHMVMTGRILIGLTGSARDAEMAMALAVVTGVRPSVEHMPLAQRNEAVQRRRRRAAPSRSVLDPLGQP